MSNDAEGLEFRRFLVELDDEVIARAELSKDRSTSADQVVLAEVIVEYLEEEGVISEVRMCPFSDTTGRRRCAITGFSIDESGSQLDLILARHFPLENNGQTVLPAAELADLAGRAARFYDYAIKGDWVRFEEHADVLDAVQLIKDRANDSTTVRVLLLTNAIARDRDLDDLHINGVKLSFETIDALRLFRISRNLTSRQDIEIDFIEVYGRALSCLEMTPRAPEYDTYLAIFSGKIIFDLYEKYGQRLFEFNVRSFLQAKGKVNKGIRDSLRDHPDRFMAYNNGIVATADSLEIISTEAGTAISKLVGLQIVNGAQTTASIYRAHKIERIDISKASVAVKITKVAPEKLQEFVPLISRFANTQNVIQIADLSANNPFHIELERLSNQIWCPGEETRWFYERARGAYQDLLQREGSTAAKKREFKRRIPPSQKFTKTDLARYLMAWIGRPHIVSMGAQKNFSVFMSELSDLFPEGWSPDRTFFQRCVAQAILFRSCERSVRANRFAAYRANISVYSYALLSHLCKGELNFGLIWDEQALSVELESKISEWTYLVDAAIRRSAGAKNVTEWCKKGECWSAVRSIKVANEALLFPEFSLGGDESRDQRDSGLGSEGEETVKSELDLGEEDEEAIRECMRYDAATWAKLNFWGVSNDSLDYYERGVAHTLSEYAALKWIKQPSKKQARIGIRVLRRGRDAKII